MTDTYQEQAQAFLDRFGIQFQATELGNIAPPWADKGQPHGLKYKVTLSRGDKGVNYQEVSFPFWNSQKAKEEGEEPTPYDVLACVSSDIYCPDTFEEFCSEYGYDTDSRKAEATFKRCNEFAQKLRGFFASEEEREALSEIR